MSRRVSGEPVIALTARPIRRVTLLASPIQPGSRTADKRVRALWALLVIVLLLVLTMLPSALRGPVALAHCSTPTLTRVTALAQGVGGMLVAGTQGGRLQGGRLYRSTDAGTCWTPLHALPSYVPIGLIVLPPGRPNVILAGVSFFMPTAVQEFKLYRSADGGATWQSGTMGLPRTPILPVEVAVTPRGTLLLSFTCPYDLNPPSGTPAAARRTLHCPYSLARSTDGGQSWQPVGPHTAGSAQGVTMLGDGSALALLIPLLPPAPDAVFSYYRSKDDGRTWQPVTRVRFDIFDDAILFGPSWARTTVFTGSGLTTLIPKVARSLDGGKHWSQVFHGRSLSSPSPILGAVVGFIGLARSHTLLFTDLSDIYRSTDEGATWARVTPHVGNNPVWALVASHNGTTAYAATGRGIYRSTDGGLRWATLGT